MKAMYDYARLCRVMYGYVGLRRTIYSYLRLCRTMYLYAGLYTAISRKVVGKNVHVTSPRGNMGYDQYTVPDSVVVKTSFIAFL